MTEHSKKTERDYWLVISALSSCAIEGNEVAIKLLELHDTDHEEFLEELKERGFLRQEGIEVK